MKKTLILIAAAIMGFSTPILAQSDDNEKEITVTNAQGKKEVIDLPEAMTTEFDSLLSAYNNKTYLQINNDCNMSDVNPVYSPEVYKERLARIPSVIELPYNDVVQQFIDRYSGRLRRSVSLMLGAQNFYMPLFEEALESYGLPLELKYLPVIESALNPNAVSRVGATGLWQFMLATGKRYGLEVNSLVDERRDPVLASYAAAQYLRDLYKIFGDWNLVIAAYNCGPENINKAIHRSKGEKDYWQIYPYLYHELLLRPQHLSDACRTACKDRYSRSEPRHPLRADSKSAGHGRRPNQTAQPTVSPQHHQRQHQALSCTPAGYIGEQLHRQRRLYIRLPTRRIAGKAY